jgi:hypothetical protein
MSGSSAAAKKSLGPLKNTRKNNAKKNAPAAAAAPAVAVAAASKPAPGLRVGPMPNGYTTKRLSRAELAELKVQNEMQKLLEAAAAAAAEEPGLPASSASPPPLDPSRPSPVSANSPKAKKEGIRFNASANVSLKGKPEKLFPKNTPKNVEGKKKRIKEVFGLNNNNNVDNAWDLILLRTNPNFTEKTQENARAYVRPLVRTFGSTNWIDAQVAINSNRALSVKYANYIKEMRPILSEFTDQWGTRPIPAEVLASIDIPEKLVENIRKAMEAPNSN